MMAGRTPNLDQIAAEGMLFTDYYAEARAHGAWIRRVLRLSVSPKIEAARAAMGKGGP
jgi:hypothetical protein